MSEGYQPRKKLSSTLMIVAIIVASIVLITIINSTEPVAQREAATKKTAMLVNVQEVRRGTYSPRIEGLGTVEAAEDIILSPRVAGRIVEISENFIPGGFVEAGEVLVKLDDADFKNRVQQMESALSQAKAELNIELGRRDVAKKEYEMLGQNLSNDNKSLVLREPQLAAARAAVKSAQAMLNQAKLELERTSIVAPFDAQILSRNTNVGSEVNTSTELARLVGINEYWVIASIPLSIIDRIQFPREDQDGAEVIIRSRTAWPDGMSRTGQVVRLIGALDDQTRLARVLISVKDPLALNNDSALPKLLVDKIVQTEIKGDALNNVFRINRDYLREGDRLWLNRNGKLVITKAKVVLKDKDFAYIAEGMEDGDLLITSNLSTVAEGINLRTEAEDESSGESLTNE